MLAGSRVQSLGQYVLGDRLGMGGMAVVFSAQCPQRGPVAIKRILPGLADDPGFVEMFWDEAHITSQLNHPNIVRLLDYGRKEAQLFMALEYVDGPSLARVLRKAAREKRALSYAALLSLAVELLDALSYVHTVTDDQGGTLKIVHRDVSPGNVMVTSGGSAKLGDFGIVCSQALARRTQPGELKGKIGYMSPEQAAGEGVTSQSDLFSVGIILAEFLTLRPLFLGKSEMQTLSRTVQVDLSTWRRHCGAVVPELRRVVERALSRDLSRRYESAKQMRAALVTVAQQYDWQLGPQAVVSELEAMGLVERNTAVSGERRIDWSARERCETEPPLSGGDRDAALEAPTVLQDQLPHRRLGRAVWEICSQRSTILSHLLLALRRAQDGLVELSAPGRTLSIEIKQGEIASTRDSAGRFPLGRLLREEDLVRPERLMQAIGESRRAGLRLGEYLVVGGRLRGATVQRLLFRQLTLRLAPWLSEPQIELRLYVAPGGLERTEPSQEASQAIPQVIAALRSSLTSSLLSETLAPVLDSVILPVTGQVAPHFALTDAETRALSTVLEGGALEGDGMRSVIERVSSERIATRREAMFALWVGLSSGMILAPGFGS